MTGTIDYESDYWCQPELQPGENPANLRYSMMKLQVIKKNFFLFKEIYSFFGS